MAPEWYMYPSKWCEWCEWCEAGRAGTAEACKGCIFGFDGECLVANPHTMCPFAWTIMDDEERRATTNNNQGKV